MQAQGLEGPQSTLSHDLAMTHTQARLCEVVL